MHDQTNCTHWTTIEQAAVTLGLSVRTVTRHINAGKLQSRLTDGRREVLLDGAAVPAGTAAYAGGPLVINELEPNGEGFDEIINYETVLALADNAADKADLAVSAYQTLAHTADERVRSNRRLSYTAWSLVAAMTVGTVVSVGWASHHITRASVEQRHLQQQVQATTAMADSMSGECDDLRRALAAAREEAARTEGKLAAFTETRDRQPEAEPATSPTLADRLASIFD